MHWIRIMMACALACAASACGDDDSGGGGGGSGSGSGAPAPKINVASSKTLSTLSGDDLMNVCDALAKVADQTLTADGMRFACTLAGALAGLQTGPNGTSTVDKAKCKQAMDDCLHMSSSGATAQQATCDVNQAKTQLMNCNATVAELQSCVDASAAALHALIGSLSCDDVSTTAPTMTAAMQSPKECQALQTQCPNLNLNGNFSAGGGSNLPPSPTGCDDTCTDAKDQFCDDGGPGSNGFNTCGFGTDCTDCGKRDPASTPKK